MKRRPKQIDRFAPTKEHFDAMSWCLKNGIKVSPVPEDWDEISLIIESGGDKVVSPKTYKNHELSKPVYEIYKHYYDKYHLKTKKS